jgi:hypothetical protein
MGCSGPPYRVSFTPFASHMCSLQALWRLEHDLLPPPWSAPPRDPNLLLLLDTVASIFSSLYLCLFIDTTGLSSVPVPCLSPSHLHLQLLTPMRPRQRPPSATPRSRITTTLRPEHMQQRPAKPIRIFAVAPCSPFVVSFVPASRGLCYPRTLHIVCFVRAEHLCSRTRLAAIRPPCADRTTCPRGWPEVSIGASRLG